MYYEIITALHLLSVISWMVGLLYLPRLFVYHSNAEMGTVRAETFKVMERRLLKAIMTPAMIASFVFGLWRLYLGWRHVIKTTLVGIFLCGVYLYFESIVIAIITHILMDVYSGTIAYHSKKAASDPISGK